MTGLVAIILSAVAWWFGSGTHPVWWLTWLAPLPLLWLAPRIRAGWAVLAAFVAYSAGGFNIWAYLHEYVGLPTLAILCFIALPGLVMAASILLFRHLLLRGRMLAAMLSIPTAWIAFEYACSLLSPHATFFNISYTQASVLPIIQLAAVTGIWGVSFLLMLLPTAASLLLWPRVARRNRWSIAAAAALAIVATVAYGSWRLLEPSTSTLRIGLVSLKERGQPSLSDKEGRARETRYVETMDHLAREGAKIVLIPETSFTTMSTSIPSFEKIANERNMAIAAGIAFHGNPGDARNMLTVFEPGTTSPATYSKHHLLVGLEEYSPGNSYTLLKGTPRTGLAICKDMDFHDIGRAYADRHTQLLLVPASDFDIDGWLHSRMAIVRGVESGFALARAAKSGRLTLSDDRGRVVAEASSEQRYAELLGDVPLHETTTLYSRWGDWFVWLDLIGLLYVLVLTFMPMRHTPYIA